MPTPWIDSIKQTHRLSYYCQGLTGQWQSAVQDAVRQFNAQSASHRLGVTFTQSRQAPTTTGGANLGIATGNGTVSISHDGTRHTATLAGQALSGLTLTINRAGQPIEKAYMFLPAQPRINTPSGQRATGIGVMKVIAFHELIHACGLHNADHTPTDVFNGFPSADPGRTAAQDRIQITVGGQYRFMPPIIFSATTATKVSRLWR